VNRFSRLEGLFDGAPGLELGRAITGQADSTFRLVHPLNEDLNLIIDLDHDFVCFGVGELRHRHRTLALVSDVDQYFVAVHGDDSAAYDLALLE
jgi:hypothetical protein